MNICFRSILVTIITLTLCLFGRAATPQEAASLAAEIARMEALLEIHCAPAVLELENLIDAGRLFRKEIARLELSYSKERQNLTRVVGDFALPTQSAGLVDGISFKFFTTYAQLQAERPGFWPRANCHPAKDCRNWPMSFCIPIRPQTKRLKMSASCCSSMLKIRQKRTKPPKPQNFTGTNSKNCGRTMKPAALISIKPITLRPLPPLTNFISRMVCSAWRAHGKNTVK